MGAVDVAGELVEGRHQPRLLEQRRMESVSQVAERVGEIADLLSDTPQGYPAISLRPTGCAGAVQLVPHQGEPLEGVVVDLARHPGPFLLLGSQEPPGKTPVQLLDPTMVEDERADQRAQDDDEGSGAGEKEPPDVGWGSGHSTPRASRIMATTSTAALR